LKENNWTYKKSGVDIEAGYEAVRLIKQHAQKTFIPGVIGGLGGFGGMFELPRGYDEPVLIAGTDGVGTKLKIAFESGIHNTIGIDCVAMCVNDIACQGAKPLFFLDYIGIGALDPQKAADIAEGISKGCIQAGCALIGGETAEMPGIYKENEYDLVGFAVGIAEKSKIIDGRNIDEGDVLVGVASSGLHSNGFSLVRKLYEAQGYGLDSFIEQLGTSLGNELLKPTKIYVPLLAALTQKLDIKGAAHITGGGWIENIPRIFANDGLKAVVKKIPAPPVFELLAQWGNIDEHNMYSTFNMGLGLLLAVSENHAAEAVEIIDSMGEEGYVMGSVAKRADEEESILIV